MPVKFQDDEPRPQRAPGFFENRPASLQWSLLVAGSLAFAAVFAAAGLPAALFLGAMIAGVLLGSNGAAIGVPRLAVYAGQTVVGCLMARSVTGDIVHAFIADWPLFVATVLVIIATSAALGWSIGRLDILPGSTAVWGTSPGGAMAMMVMSGAFGADVRLVAFMQYLRVVMVAGIASVVARVWIGAPAHPIADPAWFPAGHWGDLAATLAIAAAGGAIGMALRIPAGALLLPMAIGAVLEATGLVTITLPQWLLVPCYACLGWSVGLGFTRDILHHAARAFVPIVLSMLGIIAVCGVLAAILVYWADVDPLTAYLATSPGGMDSIAIIGAASSADLSFVMGLQVARLLLVLTIGPPLARFVARHM